MEDRINKLRKYISKEGIDAILISSVANIEYLTNFFNFSKEERDAYLLITKEENYLVTSILYTEAFKSKKWDFTLAEISAKSRTKEILEKIRNKHRINKLAIEEDDLKVREYKNLKKIFNKLVNFDLPDFRTNKSEKEINLITKACQIGDKIFGQICKEIRVGTSEKEVALKIKKLALEYGADDVSFVTIAAFNKNSAIPHHQSGDEKLAKEEGQIVLMDFGVRVGGYCSDMTRTVFLGKPSVEKKKIYETVLISQQKAVDYLKNCLQKNVMPRASEIFKVASEYTKAAGFGDISHGLGHGIGLEVHEHPHISPGIDYNLAEGMVFSIEPGIYLPKIGGVRVEDLYYIKNGKLIQLTKSPSHLFHL